MSGSPIISEQLDDIQGMLSSGFGWLRSSRFWLLTIGDEEKARAWLVDLLRSGLVVTAQQALEGKDSSIGEAVAVAFSFAGLTRLGLEETSSHPFPTPFRSGMGSPLREGLMNDAPRNRWRWSDVRSDGRQEVHIVVANWHVPDAKLLMPTPHSDAFSVIKTIENRPSSFREDGKLYEPFGFRDGIAQPVIRDLRPEKGENPERVRRDARDFYEDRVTAPGEFVVGYRNEYDELTYCPDLKNWEASGRANHPKSHFALNGSYLAIRQIEQNVAAFNALEAKYPKRDDLTIGERLMGRRKNGLPLFWKGNRTKVSDSSADAFRFRVHDADGFTCPKGAHIRRSNPRDSLGADIRSSIKAAKLHKLLRRGRPYLERAEDETAPKEGLFFIACNADIERQFEFIHQRWIRNIRFGNLHHEDDPVVGKSESCKQFTVPRLPTGDEVSFAALTETLGGGYFFLPGIRALKFIAEHRSVPASATATGRRELPA